MSGYSRVLLLGVVTACGRPATPSASPTSETTCEGEPEQPHCRWARESEPFCGGGAAMTPERAAMIERTRRDVRVCHGCSVDADCGEKADGRCVLHSGRGCSLAARVCVYPDDECYPPGEACRARPPDGRHPFGCSHDGHGRPTCQPLEDPPA